MGATGLAYEIATQFGLHVLDTRLALCPSPLGRIGSNPCGRVGPARISNAEASFDEALLFTQSLLTTVLQISSYWREGEEIAVHLLPDVDLFVALRARQQSGRKDLTTELARHLPTAGGGSGRWQPQGAIGDQSDAALQALCDRLKDWRLKPTGTEGYRTAEVTLSGIDTVRCRRAVETKAVPGLYAIGEAVDVTGWLAVTTSNGLGVRPRRRNAIRG